MGHILCYSQSEVVYAYQVLEPLLQGFLWENTIFSAFSHYHGNHFPEFLADVLS